MGEKEFKDFIEEMSTVQANVIDEVVKNADKYGIDRDVALEGFVATLMIFAETSTLKTYEVN